MEEIWKPVIGYEGLYEVSNLGNGRNARTKKNIGWISSTGYKQVTLRKNGEEKDFLLHRLVAEAFIPNPNNYPCVDHWNTVKTDNRVENLRWVSYAMNNANPLTREKSCSEENRKKTSERFKGNQYAKGHKHTEEWKQMMSEKMKGRTVAGYEHTEEWKQMMSEKMTGHRHNKSQEIPIIVDGDKYYESIAIACRELNLRKSRVSEILRGVTKRHSHKGHTFSYAKQ